MITLSIKKEFIEICCHVPLKKVEIHYPSILKAWNVYQKYFLDLCVLKMCYCLISDGYHYVKSDKVRPCIFNGNQYGFLLKDETKRLYPLF